MDSQVPASNVPPAVPASGPPPVSVTGAASAGSIFTGRLSRLGYLMSIVYTLVGYLILGVIGALLIAVHLTALFIILAIISVIVLIPVGIGLEIRRWHDFDQSGWLVLLGLIPIVSFIILLVMLFVPGTAGPNKYGDVFTDATDFKAVFGLKR